MTKHRASKGYRRWHEVLGVRPATLEVASLTREGWRRFCSATLSGSSSYADMMEVDWARDEGWAYIQRRKDALPHYPCGWKRTRTNGRSHRARGMAR